MGIVFRQSVKTSIVVFSGAALGLIITWISTKYIPKQQLGFTRNLTNQAVSFSQILLLGMNSTLFIYTHRYANDTTKKKVLLTISLILPFVLGVVITLFYFLFKVPIINHFQVADRPLMAQYFAWAPLFMVMFTYLVILEQYLAYHMKVAISAFMREVLLRVINISLIFLYAFNIVSFHTLVVGSILIYFVPICIFLYLTFSTKDVGLSLNLKIFNRSEYKEMSVFAWYHFLQSIAAMLMGYLDQLLLPIYDKNGMETLAPYSVSIVIISFLQMPSKAFLPATYSVLTKAFTEKNYEEARDIFVRSSLNILIPTIGLAVLLVCNLNNAVAVIGNGKNYAALPGIFTILLIGQLINLSTGINDQVLSITNYYKFIFYTSLVLSAILCFLLRTLVPAYGVYGAAWSATITLGLFNLAKFAFIWKKLDMQPFTKNSLMVFLAALPALAVGLFFPNFFADMHHMYLGSVADAGIRSTIIIIVYVLMLLWLRPSADLVTFIASVKKNKRLF